MIRGNQAPDPDADLQVLGTAPDPDLANYADRIWIHSFTPKHLKANVVIKLHRSFCCKKTVGISVVLNRLGIVKMHLFF
jgi:hypothetical protein